MRARLVAQIAGQVAAGYVARMSGWTPDDRIARWSVDLAEQIVDEVAERMEDDER